MTNQPGTIRLAVIDTDSSFLTVLVKRLDGAGWEYRVLSSSVPVEELVAMKLNALVVDIALLGPPGWEFLERVCGSVPGLGVLVCLGPVDGRPARPRPAARRRRLDRQALPPRGGHGPGRGGRAAPPPRDAQR